MNTVWIIPNPLDSRPLSGYPQPARAAWSDPLAGPCHPSDGMHKEEQMKLSRTLGLLSVLLLLVAGAAWSGGGKEPEPAATAVAKPGAGPYAYDDMAKHYEIWWQDNNWTSVPIPSDDLFREYVEEYFNISLKGTWPKDLDAEIRLQAAADDLPDHFTLNNKLLAQQLYEKGLVMRDWEPKLKQYMPTLDGYMAKVHRLQMTYTGDMAELKGQVYGWPKFWGGSALAPLMRKDWLDKLGLPVPKTWEEFTNAVIAFATKDPDGNGKNDTYGVYGLKDQQPNPFPNRGPMGSVTGPAFGNWGGTGTYVDKAGHAAYGLLQPTLKEEVDWYRSIIAKNAIVPDWLTDDQSGDPDQWFASGKLGFYVSYPWISDVIDTVKKNDPKAEVIAVYFNGPHGDSAWPPSGIAGSQIQMVSAKAVADPGKAKRLFHWIDEMQYPHPPYNAMVWGYGIPGNPVPAVVDQKTGLTYYDQEKNNYNPNLPANQWVWNWIGFQDVTHDPQTGNALGSPNAWYYIDAMKMIPKNTRPLESGWVLEPYPDNEVSSSLTTFLGTNILSFMLAKKPMSEWDAFVQEAWTKYRAKDIFANDVNSLLKAGLITQAEVDRLRGQKLID
jgi:putative aldouronate transport system substrate-binding protein